MSLIQKIFGTHSENELKRIYPIADAIEALEPVMQKLTDSELKEKTREFKKRLAEGETLDDILPEAYAVVREAAVRTLGMKHYRVQLIGGIILHQGRIAEMKTGEGKTLVSTLPAYLNALAGEGVHIVTVSGWDKCMSSLALPLASYSTAWTTTSAVRLITATSHMSPTMSWASII